MERRVEENTQCDLFFFFFTLVKRLSREKTRESIVYYLCSYFAEAQDTDVRTLAGNEILA